MSIIKTLFYYFVAWVVVIPLAVVLFPALLIVAAAEVFIGREIVNVNFNQAFGRGGNNPNE